MIEKYSNFEKVNEGAIEDMTMLKNAIEKTGNEIYVWTANDQRLYVRFNSKDVFNTNSNMIGVQGVVTYLAGLLAGITYKK